MVSDSKITNLVKTLIKMSGVQGVNAIDYFDLWIAAFKLRPNYDDSVIPYALGMVAITPHEGAHWYKYPGKVIALIDQHPDYSLEKKIENLFKTITSAIASKEDTVPYIFEDLAAAETIREMGGVDEVKYWKTGKEDPDDDDYVWKKKEFATLYQINSIGLMNGKEYSPVLNEEKVLKTNQVCMIGQVPKETIQKELSAVKQELLAYQPQKPLALPAPEGTPLSREALKQLLKGDQNDN